MPLKLSVADLNEVPENLRSLYRDGTNGGHILDVEGGVVAKSVHDEFRSKNVELMKKLQGFGDLKPEQVEELRTKITALEGDLDKARKGKDADAEARIKALTEGHTKALSELTASRDGLQKRLESVLIDGAVAKVAAEVGAHTTAIDDISWRIRQQFKLGEDGKPVALDEGGNKIFMEDGNPLTIEGAVRSLTKKAPHLFQSSSGGGAPNSSAGGGRPNAAANPWKKDTWNVTEQMKAIKADKSEATRMAAEAGHKLPV